MGAAPAPYRNHKLTRLLADSLGGGSRTLMVATVQTGGDHFRPSLTTLRFAARARDIISGKIPIAEPMVGCSWAAFTALQAKVEELHERLCRRDEEIRALEELQAERIMAHERAKTACNSAAHEALAAAEKQLAKAQAEAEAATSREEKARSQIIEMAAVSARAEAQLAYEAASARAKAELAYHAEREARLLVFQAEQQVEAANARAAAAEAEILPARALAHADSALAVSGGNVAEALRHATENWRADREALAGSLETLAASQTALAEVKELLQNREDALAATEAEKTKLEKMLGKAAQAAAVGCMEMDELKKVLEVLDEERGAESASAAASLSWLRLKLVEVAQRFETRQPAELQEIIGFAAPEMAPTEKRGGGRRKMARNVDGDVATSSRRSRPAKSGSSALHAASTAPSAAYTQETAPSATSTANLEAVRGRVRSSSRAKGSSRGNSAHPDHHLESISVDHQSEESTALYDTISSSTSAMGAVSDGEFLRSPNATPSLACQKITAPTPQDLPRSPELTVPEPPKAWNSIASLLTPSRMLRGGDASILRSKPTSTRPQSVFARAAEAFFPTPTQPGAPAPPVDAMEEEDVDEWRRKEEAREKWMKPIRAEAIAQVIAASSESDCQSSRATSSSPRATLVAHGARVPPTVQASVDDQREISEGSDDEDILIRGKKAKRPSKMQQPNKRQRNSSSAPRLSEDSSSPIEPASRLDERSRYSRGRARQGSLTAAAPPLAEAKSASKQMSGTKRISATGKCIEPSASSRGTTKSREKRTSSDASPPQESEQGARPRIKPFKVGGHNKGLLFVPLVESEVPIAAKAPPMAPPLDVLSPHRLNPNARVDPAHRAATGSPIGSVAPSQKRKLFNPKKGRKNSGLCNFNTSGTEDGMQPRVDEAVEAARQARRDRRAALGLTRVSAEGPMAPPLARESGALEPIPLRGLLVA